MKAAFTSDVVLGMLDGERDCVKLLNRVADGSVEGWIPYDCVSSVYATLLSVRSREEARRSIGEIVFLFKTLALPDREEYLMSFNTRYDVRDAVLAESMRKADVRTVVTMDPKRFTGMGVEAVTPGRFG